MAKLLFFLLMAFAPFVFSQESELTVEEIVVTGTRSEQETFNMPNTVKIIKSDEIKTTKLSRTLADSMKDMPGVMLQKTAQGQNSPYIRGFTGFRVLYLIDSIRLNNSIFRDGPNQYSNTVDPLGISEVEVIKGPNSVLYGSDAIGGVVNVQTKSFKDNPQDLPFGVYLRLSDAEQSQIGHFEGGSKIGENWTLFFDGSYKSYGDIRGGEGTGILPKTGYKEYFGDIKFEYQQNARTNYTFLYQRAQQDDAWRTHSTIFSKSFSGSQIGTDKKRILDQDRELLYLGLKTKFDDSFVKNLQVKLSQHSQWESEDRVKSNDSGEQQGLKVKTIGLNLQMDSPTNLGKWTYGFDVYTDYVSSYKDNLNSAGQITSSEIQGPVADDATYSLVDPFLQNEYVINDRFELTTGIHIAYAHVEANKVKDPLTSAQTSVNNTWRAGLGSIKLLHHLVPEKNINVFASVSQGFRAPNLSDLTRLDIARSGEVEIPSYNLDPENYICYELGTKMNKKDLRGEVTVFYTDINKMIVRQPTGAMIGSNREVKKINAGDGFVYGIELFSEKDINHRLSTYVAFTFQEGKVQGYPTSQPEQKWEWMSRLSPMMTTWGMVYKPTDQWRFESIFTVASKQDRLSSSDEADIQRIPPNGTPGYSVWSLRSRWEVKRTLGLSLVAENIFDVNYRIHGSGVNEPGRNIVAALDWRF